MTRTRVIIVDDQRLIRQYLELVVSGSDRYEVVRQFETAQFVDTFVLGGTVDLALVDVLMADGSSSFEAVRSIKSLRPDVKVIMLTSVPEASWMDEARRCGADGFWYKDSAAEGILDVMDRIMAGETVYPDAPPAVRVGRVSSADLTQREVEILRALVDGLSNDEMADRMGLSTSTVKTHMRHLIEKTGCENRTHLALTARLSGLVVGSSEIGG